MSDVTNQILDGIDLDKSRVFRLRKTHDKRTRNHIPLQAKLQIIVSVYAM